MEFRIKVKDVGEEDSTAHWETYDENVDNPHEWANNIINRYNDTLRPREKTRELLEVEILDEESKEKHDWTRTNLMTISSPGESPHDTMQCKDCGITGKRYGLSGDGVQRDSMYRYKIYHRCDTAKEHFRKKLEKQI